MTAARTRERYTIMTILRAGLIQMGLKGSTEMLEVVPRPAPETYGELGDSTLIGAYGRH